MPRAKKQLLSVVVPAYKQEKTIRKDLESIDKSLSEGLPAGYGYEIICVVDGVLDSTLREAKKVKSPNVKVFAYKKNQGKGHAVRYGMEKSKGELVSFLDAGMEISPKSLTMLMAHLEWYNADVIVGSKRHPVSRVNYPLLRHVLSVGYHLGVRILFRLNLRDTQSGIKIFRRKVVQGILPRLLVKTYAMDIEMLAVSRYLGFGRIYEAPIEVRFDQRTSRIDLSTIFKMAWDTAAVFYRLRILRYYRDSNRRNWIR